ncbi:MAG: peroxidase-related enzyme [Bryobacteraceae bacterium]
MPHISLPPGLPGIRGLFAYRLETAEPLSQLAQVLLHDSHTLSRAERELIATYVSSLNDCFYCQTSHGALASHYLCGHEETVATVKEDFRRAPVSDKLKALLAIAAKVQRGGKNVKPEDIEQARAQGATDLEIHDTVLIAAAFCMYNRYVDGLATWAPPDTESYRQRAAGVAEKGYLQLPKDLQAQRLKMEQAE